MRFIMSIVKNFHVNKLNFTSINLKFFYVYSVGIKDKKIFFNKFVQNVDSP